VSSSTGAGATFTLWLPATDNRGQISETEPPVTPAVNKSATRISRRVLVMDDEEIICDLATSLLEHLGCEVESAADGLEAIKKHQSAKGMGKPFDVIIMDLTIPNGQGGRETIKQLRELDREVKVVVSSGYSDDPIMADHQAYGFNAAMPKPYSFDKLQQVVAGLFI
jgi:CheY-like chemotaxis protein